MGYKKEYYIKALADIAKRRLTADELAKKNLLSVYLSHPDIKELDDKMNALGLLAVKSAVKLSGAEEIINFKKEYEIINAQKQELLSKYNISLSSLKPSYCCENCNDTGYVNGELCACAKKTAKEYYFNDLCEKMPLEKSTFGSFDLSLYPDDAQNNMQEIFNFSKDYSDNFTNASKNLLFLGRTGLGKTHLSLSIANIAIDKGYGVIYGSSQNFFNQIQDEAFGRKQGDTLNALLECDLLILDDFGTEFMSTYISSAIYNIINSRILRSLPTIISTNLSLSEINNVYGERIMSRILGNYIIKQFTGKDIRQIQMLKNNT